MRRPPAPAPAPPRRLVKQALGFLLLSCLISVGARMLPESQDSDLEDTSSSVPASAAADGAAAGRRLLASAGDMTVGTRIVGGTQASPSRFPYVCSLRTAKGDHFCGGTLIHPLVVLTAAHCVYDSANRLPTVHIGRRYTIAAENGFDDRKAVVAVIHTQYNPATSANDIALILLDSPSTKEPLALPTYSVALVGGTPVVVIGYGSTSEGSAYLSSTLQQVTVPYLTDATCKSIYNNSQILPGMLCAGDLAGGKDSCQGDSGGPLLIPGTSGKPTDDLQLGVVSWGYGCARPDLPGVYASSSYYRSWIARYVNSWTSPKPSPPPSPKPSPKPSPPPSPLPSPPPSPKPSPPPSPKPSPPPSPQPSPPPSPKPSPPPATLPAQTQQQPAQDPCVCSADGVSGGVKTGRKGCDQHGRRAVPRDLTWHCFVVGGTACRTATPSSAFNGAAWVKCGKDAPVPATTATTTTTAANPTNPSVSTNPSNGSGPTVVMVSGPGQIASVSANGLAARSQEELCRCSADGISNGVNTGRRGCARHGAMAGNAVRHCYVTGGVLCTAPGVNPSPSFPGAAWKTCSRDSD